MKREGEPRKDSTQKAGPARPDDERSRLIFSTLDAIFPDIVKRLFFTSAGMLFLTEGGLRKLLSEMRYPKEIVGTVVEQTLRTRKEFFRVAEDELRRFLARIDPAREMKRILDGMTLEVAMQLRFRANEAAKLEGEPRIRASFRKRGKGGAA